MGHSKCQSARTGKRDSAVTGEASLENQLIWELLGTRNTESAFGEGGSFPHSQPEQMWEAGEHHHAQCIQGDP